MVVPPQIAEGERVLLRTGIGLTTILTDSVAPLHPFAVVT